MAAIALLAVGLPFSNTAASTSQASTATHAARVASSPACRKASGPFHVTGTKVTGARGKLFVPYGITVPGLGNSDYRGLVPLDVAKIIATARFWCANTVRLQISQANLVGAAGARVSHPFLQAIETEVRAAEKAQLVVVLNAQTEDNGLQLAPTRVTASFWKVLSRVYGHDPQVIFDLFNQPRVFMQASCGDSKDWTFWHRGGRFDGTVYLGMQPLVNDIRRDGATNVLWLEGPCFANSLAGLPGHEIEGKDLVYAFQHPRGDHDASQWYADFGSVLFRHIAPVVDAEWSNYAANKTECWPDAPRAVPAFLRYLQQRGIGLTAFQLKQGVLIRTRDLTDPTHIYTRGPAKWRCASGLNEGIGLTLLTWYRRLNA